MEKHPNVSMDTVFNCVIPYIHDGDDRNSVSLVCRKWYELDCITRKHVTVHLFYSPTPSRLHQRFPFLESLTLKGLPIGYPHFHDIDITPWIQEISVSFKCLKALHICRMVVGDSDLELLARTRGKDLRGLMIDRCKGFSTDGLLHIGKYCNNLRTLSIVNNLLVGQRDGKWLHELALHNTGIESLDIRRCVSEYDDKDLTTLAKNCSQSLVTLKLSGLHEVDFLSYAVRLEDFSSGKKDEDEDTIRFKIPPNLRCVDAYFLTKQWFPSVLTRAHQIRELNLSSVDLDVDSQCFLIQRCPILEVLYTKDFGDMEMQVIGQCCKKLRQFTNSGLVTQTGLITVAQGCLELEHLHIQLTHISNEILECIGTHLKNLRDFHMALTYKYSKTTLPLDNGIRAMLIGCSKLERLVIYFRLGGLTDIGLGYIGKYGHNLRYLFLSGCIIESDAGVVELSKGCPKLRELTLDGRSFSEQELVTILFNIQSLRYLQVCMVSRDNPLAMTRPNFEQGYFVTSGREVGDAI